MEQITNIPSTAATDEPAVPATLLFGRSRARISDKLTDSLIEAAADAADSAAEQRPRRDGWDGDKMRIFLTALAECGTVEDAARAAGMSRQGAYALRRSARGAGFAAAWDAAEHLARPRLADEAMSRALHGCVEVIVRDGVVWGERHRFDNRHLMAVLARLDRKAESDGEANRAARLIAAEFDQFLDIVCARDGEGAAEFVATRCGQEWKSYAPVATLKRNENYRRYGVGMVDEIDTSDLDPEEMDGWSPQQMERAMGSGLLERHMLSVLAEEEETADGAEEMEPLDESQLPIRPQGIPAEAWLAFHQTRRQRQARQRAAAAAGAAPPARDPGPAPSETPSAAQADPSASPPAPAECGPAQSPIAEADAAAAAEPPAAAPADDHPPPGWVATDR